MAQPLHFLSRDTMEQPETGGEHEKSSIKKTARRQREK
jgi:hypothetical protein